MADAVCCAGGDKTVTEEGRRSPLLCFRYRRFIRVPEKPGIDVVSVVVGAVKRVAHGRIGPRGCQVNLNAWAWPPGGVSKVKSAGNSSVISWPDDLQQHCIVTVNVPPDGTSEEMDRTTLMAEAVCCAGGDEDGHHYAGIAA